MALKSGLLAESTWALDTLTVLLYDDTTVSYFHLQHMPGLVEVLLEHYRHCLIAIFDTFHDLETNTKRSEYNSSHTPNSSMNCTDTILCDKSLGYCNMPEGITEKEPDGRILLSPTSQSSDEQTNFTYQTRQNKPVKIEQNSDVINTVMDPKHWDQYQGFDSGMDMWMVGQGFVTDHIVTQFESTETTSKLHKCFYGGYNTAILEELSKEKPPMLEKIEKEHMNSPHEDAKMCSLGSLITAASTTITNTISTVNTDDDCDKENCSNSINTPADHDPEICLKELQSSWDTREARAETESVYEALYEVSNVEVKKEKDADIEDTSEAEIKSEVKSDKIDIRSEETSAEDKITSSSGQSKIEEDIQPFVYYPEGDDDKCTKEDMLCVETLKRKYDEMEGEAEVYTRDQYPLDISSQTDNEISQRCLCISNILRNLSFLPGNEVDLARHRSLMTVLGRLLLFHHDHPKKTEQQKYDRDTELGDMFDFCPDKPLNHEWWWDMLEVIRENTLVTLANISGYLHLQEYPEEVTLPILDGLLHWAVCPSSYAMDTMPSMSRSDLTPQRLVLETMCKLCVNKTNVDLLFATPPYSRILYLIAFLVRLLSDKRDQVLREFSIVLLSSMVESSSAAARAVALHHPSVALLIDFIESAELAAQQMNLQPPITSEHTDMLGTSMDMLKRVASALAIISAAPVNKSMFIQHQPRLLQLVMSHYLDHSVSSHLADVLFSCSQS